MFIKYCVSIVTSNNRIAHKIKILLAEKFRGLWIKIKLYDELEEAAKEIYSCGSWKEGWLAVRSTKSFDGKDMKPEVFSRLTNLDIMLKPNTLIERVKLYAFSSHLNSIDLVDTIEDEDVDCYLAVEKITRSLGFDVAINDEIFKVLLPEMLSNDGAGLFAFGQGLADGAQSHEKMWLDFCEQLSLLKESKRTYQVLRGF